MKAKLIMASGLVCAFFMALLGGGLVSAAVETAPPITHNLSTNYDASRGGVRDIVAYNERLSAFQGWSPGVTVQSSSIIFNDTEQTYIVTGLTTDDGIRKADLTEETSAQIMNEWMKSSFNIPKTGLTVADAPIAQHPGAVSIFEDTAPYGPRRTVTNQYVFSGYILEPGESITVDFTYSHASEAGNITQRLVQYFNFTVQMQPLATPTTHTVHYMDGETEIHAQEVNDGETTTFMPPAREGFQFDGWFTDPNLQNSFDASTPITADTILYGKWTKIIIPPVDPPVDPPVEPETPPAPATPQSQAPAATPASTTKQISYPAELPHTGSSTERSAQTTILALLLSILTYGVVYFAQPRKWFEEESR